VSGDGCRPTWPNKRAYNNAWASINAALAPIIGEAECPRISKSKKIGCVTGCDGCVHCFGTRKKSRLRSAYASLLLPPQTVYLASDRFAVLRVITTRRLLDAARRPASGVGRCRSSGVPRVQLVNGRRDSVQPRMKMCRRRQLNPIAIEDFEWDWPLDLNPIAGSLLRKRLLQLECPWFESRCDGGISGAVSNKGMRQC
jgi:hypothetical protein